MKDKLLTYAFIILMVFALFAAAWPFLSKFIQHQVEKVDDVVPPFPYVNIPSSGG